MIPQVNKLGLPKPGFYRLRMVKGGPWVPVKIWLEDGERDPETNELMSDQVLRAKVGDQERDPFKIWGFLWDITEEEYAFLLSRAHWAVAHTPTAPEANPKRPIRQTDVALDMPAVTIYRGTRAPDTAPGSFGALAVTVYKPGVHTYQLPLYLGLRAHSPDGFECGMTCSVGDNDDNGVLWPDRKTLIQNGAASVACSLEQKGHTDARNAGQDVPSADNSSPSKAPISAPRSISEGHAHAPTAERGSRTKDMSDGSEPARDVRSAGGAKNNDGRGEHSKNNSAENAAGADTGAASLRSTSTIKKDAQTDQGASASRKLETIPKGSNSSVPTAIPRYTNRHDAGCAQLALALLADHLGDHGAAVAHYQGLAARVVARLPRHTGWRLSSDELDRAMEEKT